MSNAPLITRRQALALAGAVTLPSAWAQPSPGWRLLHEHTLPEVVVAMSLSGGGRLATVRADLRLRVWQVPRG